jgi:hypothetical protein
LNISLLCLFFHTHAGIIESEKFESTLGAEGVVPIQELRNISAGSSGYW